MHEKLKHLSEYDVEMLMERYYTKENIKELVEEFKIDVHASGLVRLFPPIELEDQCPYCEDVHMVQPRTSRSEPNYRTVHPKCPSCSHMKKERCRCNNCEEMKLRTKQWLENNRRLIIEETYSTEHLLCPNIETLSLKDAIYLLAVIRHSTSEDLRFVAPFSDVRSISLAPTFDFQREIALHLARKSLIAVSPFSETNAFVFDENHESANEYYTTKVLWELFPNMSTDEKKSYIKELESLVTQDDSPEGWSEEIPHFWRLITKNECLEYFLYSLDQRGFELGSIGEKTHTALEHLVENYSVSQATNLIWQTARDVTDYIVREDIPTYRGKNMFIGSLQKKIDKYKAESWEVRHSRRDFNCPQTTISSVFFDTFLCRGEAAFQEIAPQPIFSGNP